ncbi:hypothetical protein P7C73_g6236, partial [Tremellales sp. Uapishka_1]
MFSDGGPGAKIHLCPGKTYRLSSTITFTSADQELATFGYPTGDERATLVVSGGEVATAVQGDCRRCKRATIRNLIIDGNRATLGRMPDANLATGLIVIGGNEGHQSILECLIKDPRGFTAVHVREGDKLACSGAVIAGNQIGPVGEEFNEAVDGPDPEMSPLGRPLGDGVSIACRDSQVVDNTFVDNTDASIVIYCSPGTLVSRNTIQTEHLSSMAGILAVDSTPFDGDYAGMTISKNTIHAKNHAIRVAIGIGSAVWSDDNETVLRGGKVVGNKLTGHHLGFGIAAAGLDDWTIKENWDDGFHSGKRTTRCFDDPPNPDPMAFMYNQQTVKGGFIQREFKNHEFAYIVCIDGMDDLPFEPQYDTPSQLDLATPEVPQEPTTQTTGSEVMDDILLHSKQRMLEKIEELAKKVEGLVPASDAIVVAPKAGDDKDISLALTRLYTRIEALEANQSSLMALGKKIRSVLRAFDEEMRDQQMWESEALLAINEKFYQYYGHSANNQEGYAPPPAKAQAPVQAKKTKSRTRTRFLRATETDVLTWGDVVKFLIGQTVFALVFWVGRSWVRRRNAHRKIL